MTLPPRDQSTSLRMGFEALELCVAELSARRVGWLSAITQPPWPVPEEMSPEKWTDRVISSLKSDTAKFGLDHNSLPSICWRMREFSASRMMWQRKRKELGDAARTSSQLLALAERLTRLYPDHAASHLLLSEAYVQRAKNAYQVAGEPAKPWEQKALEAALRAVTVAPDNDDAHARVRACGARLQRLKAS